MVQIQSRRVLVVFTILAVVSVSNRVLAGCCCPTYWTAFQDHCYRFYGKSVTFDAAELACQEHSVPSRQDNRTSLGHLVSVHSVEENNFVTSLLMSSAKDENQNVPEMWIGLHDRSTEDEFEWTDGSPTDYTKWAPNQPDNWRSNEDCVQLLGRLNENWIDIPCASIRHYFVCKMPMW